MASIFQRIFGEKVKPRTRAVTNEGARNYFTQRNRDVEQLKRYETIYNQGGVVTTAIDTYAMHATAKGYTLEGKDEGLVDDVKVRLDAMDFGSVCFQGVVDALVFGDCFQEIIRSKRHGDVMYVLPRSARSFDIIHDEYGRVSGYRQTYSVLGIPKHNDIGPRHILSFPLFKTGGSMYGRGILPAAYDDIMRDTKTAESTAAAVERHGFRKYHARVGLEGETIPKDVLDAVAGELEDLNGKNEIVTPHDVDIGALDSGPLGNVAEINHASIDRLLSALGVPGELVGLAWGSTEATAKVKLQSFFLRVSAIQRQVARAYTLQLVDEITGRPGAVGLVFNDPDPQSLAAKADYVSKLLAANPLDPYAIIDDDKAREILGMTANEAE